MTEDEFDRQLPHRVMHAQPTPAENEFACHVRSARQSTKMSRADLARETGLQQTFLAFLENGLLLPGELTEDARQRIEAAISDSRGQYQGGIDEQQPSVVQ
jgi:ribosome-binding protein aMBF1 (putative translation factor)